MHVVYKTADEQTLSDAARRIMLHPALLRENVDGESIVWAHDRLIQRPERHKFLIILSDGAPVDDSTLLENGPNYLFRHLKSVIEDIEADEVVALAGIGIAHRVEELYEVNETVERIERLPEAGIAILKRLFVKASARAIQPT